MRSHLRVPMGTPTFVAVALVLTAAALLEAVSGSGYRASEVTPLTLLVSLSIGASLLLARWSAPAGLVLLLAALVAAAPFSDLPPVGGTHLIVTMLLVGLISYRHGFRLGLACYVAAAVVPAATIVAAGETFWEFPFFALMLAPPWVVGRLLRREQERSAELVRLTEALEAERGRQAEVAVAAERTRISRELHDAVAHTVSVMTLQVGVVRRRLGDDSVEGATLRGAETLGRQAVDELRRIVGLVREGEAAALAPLPSLSQLGDLAEQVRGTGTAVSLEVEGDLADVPQAVDMSAYRIVQEALTNVLRHAPGATAEVTVSVGRGDLRIRVVNSRGTRLPAAHGEPVSGGNGLVGMRERVAVLGGTLEAAPTGDGGFAVRAALPLTASRRLPPSSTVTA